MSPALSSRRSRPSTREHLLEVARELFNVHGYSQTTLARIAATAGVAEGNLWYHFRAKEDLVAAVLDELTTRRQASFDTLDRDAPAWRNCLAFLVSVHRDMQRYRFLLRDHLQVFADRDSPNGRRVQAFQQEQFARLREVLEAIGDEGGFRRPVPDLDELACNLWIVGRYWTAFLADMEGVHMPDRAAQRRGLLQHLSVLRPHLTAAVNREFTAALDALDGGHEALP